MVFVDKVSKNIRRLFSSRWLPWLVSGIILGAFIVFEILPSIRSRNSTPLNQFVLGLVVFAALAILTVFLQYFMKLVNERELLKNRFAAAERRVEDAYLRLEAIFRVSQKFVEASDENEVIEPVLSLLISLTGARGASFVPLDEHGQPRSTFTQGEMPFTVMDAWLEYLASPGVRERCSNCENKETRTKPNNCPLLVGPFSQSVGLFCISVRRGERVFGVLNIFLPDSINLDEKTHAFLGALVDEMALGLESVYLRRRELSALRQIQVLRKRADLTALLSSLLENVYRTLEADFALMIVPQAGLHQSKIDLTVGEFPMRSRPFIDGILQGVMASREPVLLGDVSAEGENDGIPRPSMRSLIAVPLLSSERTVLGVLLVGNRRVRSLHQRQLALLQTIAGQVALVVQNASLMAELEFQSMIQERARLAREIHDGLAQTIGFLKLQAAQARNQLARGELDRLRQNLDLFHATLSEAYQDARQAIDGLRISPDECGLPGWLEQITDEFSDLSGLPVQLELQPIQRTISPEVQAQLVRVLQEALNNIRKHARAHQVWVACKETPDDLVLEVRDDGDGFLPEDVSAASRYGLRGMQERAELVGADFQVISRPHEGTIVRLTLPTRNLQETVQ